MAEPPEVTAPSLAPLRSKRHVVDLEEFLDLRDPPPFDEGDVVGMAVVAVIGGLVGELQSKPKVSPFLRLTWRICSNFSTPGIAASPLPGLEEGPLLR